MHTQPRKRKRCVTECWCPRSEVIMRPQSHFQCLTISSLSSFSCFPDVMKLLLSNYISSEVGTQWMMCSKSCGLTALQRRKQHWQRALTSKTEALFSTSTLVSSDSYAQTCPPHPKRPRLTKETN